jgi:hypothetical protein
LAEAETPEVIKAIYAAISEAVEAHPGATSHRSSSLIQGIPPGWFHQGPGLASSPSAADRRSLFEQVLWTFFFDRSETWETTWPEPGRQDAEYVAVAKTRPVAPSSGPGPGGVAEVSGTAGRGIAPAGRGIAPAGRGIAPAGRGIAPATPAAQEQEPLAIGDIVEIIDGAYSGFRGKVMGLGTGGSPTIDLELWVAGVLRTFEGFYLPQVRKVEDG